MGDMIKQPSPSPRAGAFSQLMIASAEYLSLCQALWDGGRSSPQKSGKPRPGEAGGLAGGRGPTSGRSSWAQAGSGQLINTDISTSEKLTGQQGTCGWDTGRISSQLGFKLDAKGWPGFKPGVAEKEITPPPFSASQLMRTLPAPSFPNLS